MRNEKEVLNTNCKTPLVIHCYWKMGSSEWYTYGNMTHAMHIPVVLYLYDRLHMKSHFSNATYIASLISFKI